MVVKDTPLLLLARLLGGLLLFQRPEEVVAQGLFKGLVIPCGRGWKPGDMATYDLAERNSKGMPCSRAVFRAWPMKYAALD